jgi:uncharacterized protein YndB with AHSA1/START domain
MSSEPTRPSAAPADRSIVLTRDYDAPRALVFRAWTDPEQIDRWWGPDGYATTTHEMDVRPGGVWRFNMRAPDGTDYRDWVEYIEVVEPERLVYHHGSEVDGKMSGAFHVTVTFVERDGKTTVTMSSLFATAEEREATVAFGAVELGYQTLARLADHLSQGR